MESHTIRRTSTPAVPVATAAPDAIILAAFARWQALHAERDTLPSEGTADDERPLWNEIDQAETQVHDLVAVTPAGLACKLWIAIPHNTDDAEPEAAAFRADLDWFVAQGDMLDWNLRCLVSTLVSLKAMETGA